jgi:predicted unusual protein kinase regulating ubiquinone biosynthesis (AarF/ABC1/UbiB family)
MVSCFAPCYAWLLAIYFCVSALNLWLILLQVITALAKLALLQSQHSSTAGSALYATDVRQLVSELGVLWVKLGQTLSVRPDLVGAPLAAALAGLQVRESHDLRQLSLTHSRFFFFT